VPPADVEQVAVVIVQHPGDRRVAGEGLRGGGADSRAVVEVAASRVRGAGKPAGRAGDAARRRACGRFRGNVGGGGCRLGRRVAWSRSCGGCGFGRFRGNAGLPCGRVIAVRPGGEGFGADVHDHLVDVGVARGGDLRGQVRPGDLHQCVGQARPAGRGTPPGMLGGPGVLGGMASARSVTA
jgi:hypothetical protein